MADALPAQKEQTFLLGMYLPLPLPRCSLSFVVEPVGLGILLELSCFEFCFSS
jgi:hypothetical protein